MFCLVVCLCFSSMKKSLKKSPSLLTSERTLLMLSTKIKSLMKPDNFCSFIFLVTKLDRMMGVLKRKKKVFLLRARILRLKRDGCGMRTKVVQGTELLRAFGTFKKTSQMKWILERFKEIQTMSLLGDI